MVISSHTLQAFTYHHYVNCILYSQKMNSEDILETFFDKV